MAVPDVVDHLAARLKECLVRVDGRALGSGFFITPNTILTCAHLAGEPGDEVRVFWMDVELPGVVRWSSTLTGGNLITPYPDLAVVALPGDRRPAVWLDDHLPRTDARLLVVGFGQIYGQSMAQSSGWFVRAGDYDDMIRLTGDQIEPGMAGAPVLNVATGGVCAVVKASRGQGLSSGGVAVPVRALRMMMESEPYRRLRREADDYHRRNQRWLRLADQLPDRSGEVGRLAEWELRRITAELPPGEHADHLADYVAIAGDFAEPVRHPLHDHSDVITELAGLLPADDDFPYLLAYAIYLARRAGPATVVGGRLETWARMVAQTTGDVDRVDDRLDASGGARADGDGRRLFGGLPRRIWRRIWWSYGMALIFGAGTWAVLPDDKALWTVVSTSLAAVIGSLGPNAEDWWRARRIRSGSGAVGRDPSLADATAPVDERAIRLEMQQLTRDTEDLVRRISQAVRRHGDDAVLRAMFDLLAAEVPVAIASAVDREVGRSALLLQQISHQLNTPLSQIETTALLMRDNSTDAKSLDSAHGLIGAVGMCKATLAGFRRASGMELGDVLWATSSLAQFVRESIEIFQAEHKKDCMVTVDLPDSFAGYHNSFLACVLMPIMENAVEAVPAGGELVVRAEAGTRDFSLLVSNSNAGDVDLTGDIFLPHRSRKDGHTGLGLSAVRDLLATYTGSGVVGNARDGMTTFTVTLPGRMPA